MILAYNDSDIFLEWNEAVPYVLVAENPSIFRLLLADLMAQIDGRDGKWVLSEKNKILVISKMVEVIDFPLLVDANTKKILTKLYEEIEKVAMDEDLYLETMEMKAKVVAYLQKVLMNLDDAVVAQEDFLIKNLCSLLNVSFDNMDNSLLERLTTYLAVTKRFTSIRILVFVNLSNFLTDEELRLFFREAEKQQIKIMLLEFKYTEKIFDEKILIVDKDWCII